MGSRMDVCVSRAERASPFATRSVGSTAESRHPYTCARCGVGTCTLSPFFFLEKKKSHSLSCRVLYSRATSASLRMFLGITTEPWGLPRRDDDPRFPVWGRTIGTSLPIGAWKLPQEDPDVCLPGTPGGTRPLPRPYGSPPPHSVQEAGLLAETAGRDFRSRAPEA